MKSFADYKKDAPNWITMANGEFYPDILQDACELYKPVLVTFGQLLKSSESSVRLLQQITDVKQVWMRVQLYRVFRKYVSPQTPVEMLKKKSMIPIVCEKYGKNFRTIDRVQAAFDSRPMPDEAICAVLWEYKDGEPVAIGFVRYDSDRGGAQEDDRTGGYVNCAHEILEYETLRRRGLKVIYVNDGPGLLLGSMWDDYAKLEAMNPQRLLVITLRMFNERLTAKWLTKK